mmetsp:Transcript_84517/g.247894  ORF Transcript_84517/g.247894 Transcript_84517/m.247894 type:complete len:470 (+) Transcript_84517:174-1583(+)
MERQWRHGVVGCVLCRLPPTAPRPAPRRGQQCQQAQRRAPRDQRQRQGPPQLPPGRSGPDPPLLEAAPEPGVGLALQDGTNLAIHKVLKLHVGELVHPPLVDGLAVRVAGPALGALRVGLVVGGDGVQPAHVAAWVVPQRDCQNHALVQGLADLLHAPKLAKLVKVAVRIVRRPCVLELILVRATIFVGQRVSLHALNGRLGVLDHSAALHVDAADLLQVTIVSAVGRDELRDDGDNLVCPHRAAVAPEVLAAHSVGVEVAAVLVADALVLVPLISITAVHVLALDVACCLAGVHGERLGLAVPLKEVYLWAAGAVGPVHVGLAVDEVGAVRAVRVAVAGAELGACFVVALALAPILLHVHQVDGSVDPARQAADVNVEGKLAVLKLEDLVVFVVVVQQVHPGADVHAILRGSHVVHPDAVFQLCNAVDVRIVVQRHAVNCALLAARQGVGAEPALPHAILDDAALPSA